VSGANYTANFANNIIAGNSASLHGGGVYELSALEATITSSFTNNTLTGNSAGYDGGGVFNWGTTTSTFANNTIARNTAYRGGGVFTTEGTTSTFTNNTIIDNSAAYLGGGLYALSVSDSLTTVDMINTIVFGNTANQDGNDVYIESYQSPGFTAVNVSYSDVGIVTNASGTYNNLGNNISLDPLFKDSANMDYHLESLSPLINQGDNSAASSISEDFEGDDRIVDDIIDIGADEYDLSSVHVAYYCDYDHDGYIESFSSNICFGAGCELLNCQTEPGSDCDDKDFYEHPNQTWYKDLDYDEYSDGITDLTSCTRPPGYKADLELTGISGDGDDTNEFINPGVAEIWYDGTDQNSDGKNDYDQDMDGYVDINWNSQAGGSAPGTDDCDDINSAVNPQTMWYPDFDGDSYGNPLIYIIQCDQPTGYVMNNNDCEDNDLNIYPGGPPVRIFGVSPLYYYWLQAAYDAASTGDTIQSQDAIFTENLVFDLNKTLNMEGGYDCSYSVITGITTVNGNITITDGSVTFQNFDLQLFWDYYDW
jgi:hypothetical protein